MFCITEDVYLSVYYKYIYIYLFRVNILIAILCNVISIILKIAKIQFINSVYCYFLEFFGKSWMWKSLAMTYSPACVYTILMAIRLGNTPVVPYYIIT